MSLIKAAFSLSNPEGGAPALKTSATSNDLPIVFSILPPLIFAVDNLRSFSGEVRSSTSGNVTPFGQIKDLSYHEPSSVEIGGDIIANPNLTQISEGLRDASIALSIGNELYNTINQGGIPLGGIVYDSYSLAMQGGRQLADLKPALYFWNFPVDFDFLFYSNPLTNSIWVLNSARFESDDGLNSLKFRLEITEEIVQVVGILGGIRKIVDKVLL